MSVASGVIPAPEHELQGAGACSRNPFTYEGLSEIFRECRSEPGQFWDVVCFGPIRWTAPSFHLTGDQSLDGFLELAPIPPPPAPAAGCRLYFDGDDGALKAVFANGAIEIIVGS